MTLKERFSLDRFLAGERTAEDTPFILNQRRIFILPTQRGMGFALLILLLMLIAFVYNNNLTYLLAFLLGSIFFITILHTYHVLAGLTIQSGHSVPVFAGDTALVMVVVDNPTAVQRHQVTLTLNTTENCVLNAYSKTSLALPETPTKRGWHTPGTVTVSSSYPLGLFRAWSPVRFNTKLMVYPKPASQPLIFPETATDTTQQGQFKKGGDEFYDLQAYQAGDSIKHLHWKAYAKGLGLYSKQYGAEQSADIWLDYDHTPGYTQEERLSILCRWVIEAEQAGLKYGFRLPHLQLAPSQGVLHYRHCLEALALF